MLSITSDEDAEDGEEGDEVDTQEAQTVDKEVNSVLTEDVYVFYSYYLFMCLLLITLARIPVASNFVQR
jgi:hypothetical protein